MIKEEKNTDINFFQRFLTVWVFLCMIVGVLLGHFAPALPTLLNKLFREQSASGQRKKQTTLFMYLPIPLDCTPIFTN